MKLLEQKEVWKDGIVDNVGEVFLDISRKLNKQTDRYNEHIIIFRRYNELARSKRLGTISPQFQGESESKIIDSLIKFIDIVSEEELLQKPEASQTKEYMAQEKSTDFINKKVLIICKDKPDYLYMEEFFLGLKANTVDVKIITEYLPVDRYDFLVFANHTIPATPKREMLPKRNAMDQNHLKLMEVFLNKSSKPGIHFGEFLFLVNEYREKIHAANSRFALYARMREMADFLDAYHF